MEPTPVAYLDHAATTPMRREALEAMLPFYGERFGNPSGSHRVSRDARRAVDEARDTVAASLGCRPSEVVFTGCGTEADSMAILGTLRRRGGVAVCSSVEHHAVLHVVEHTGGRVVGVDPCGRINLDELAEVLDGDVSVVSVMAVNNEVGSISPIDDVAALVRSRAPQALLHTDAIQAVTWMDLRPLAAKVDLLSLSAHKFGGPKGVGVLMVRDGISLEPLLLGGGQEHDRRSGTHNVAGIVALATALRIADERRNEDVARIAMLRDRLVDGLHERVPGMIETVPRETKVAGSAHVCFEGVDSESLLFLADDGGVCASAASACASGAMEPSHVLAAMGTPRSHAGGAIRLTLGYTTTQADVDRALEVLSAAVRRIRERTSSTGSAS
jgi:cysteine desulfurase